MKCQNIEFHHQNYCSPNLSFGHNAETYYFYIKHTRNESLLDKTQIKNLAFTTYSYCNSNVSFGYDDKILNITK